MTKSGGKDHSGAASPYTSDVKHTHKPILLKNKHNSPESQNRRKGIVWDEEKIAEHDLERGTRQVIDEPKTPYHEPINFPEGDDHEIEVPPPLNLGRGATANSAVSPSASLKESDRAAEAGEDDDASRDSSEPAPLSQMNQQGMDQGQFMAALKQKLEFQQKRKAHYNMGALLKSRPADDEDDDDEDESQTSDAQHDNGR